MRIKYLIMLALFGIMFIGLVSASECWNGTAGAVAWWSLNSTSMVEECFNSNNGTNNGATSVGGKFDNALDYESGDPDWGTIGAGSRWQFVSKDTTYTYCFWANVESSASAQARFLLHKKEGIAPYWLGVWQHTDDTIKFARHDNANTDTCISNVVDFGVWSHYCAQFDDPTGNFTLWINGTYYTNDATDSMAAATGGAGTLYVARWASGASNYYDGKLDEIAIFNYSLSPTEINNMYLYNNITGLGPPAPATIWNYTILKSDYDTPVYETNNTDFNFSIATNTSQINNVNATLIWNGTAYGYTSSGNNTVGDNNTYWYAYENFTLPLVLTNDTSITTFWNYSIYWANTTIGNFSHSSNTQHIYHAYYWTDYYPDTAVLWGDTLNLYGNITDLLSLATYNLWADFNSTDFTLAGAANPYSNSTTAPEIVTDNYTWVSNATLNVSFTSDELGYNNYERISENESITVYMLQIGNCTDGLSTTVYLNYTGYNETAVTTKLLYDLDSTFWVYANPDLDGLNTTYSDNRTGANSYIFCIYPAWATAYVNSWQHYYNENSSVRAYFLDNSTITNTTSYVSLYLLDETDDMLIQVSLKDVYGNGYEDAYIYFNRYYVEENVYRTVAMCKTDEAGQCNTYLEPNDVWYRMQIVKDHEIVYTFSPQTISCNPTGSYCTLTMDMASSGTYGEYFDYWDEVAYSCEFVTATNTTTCTVTDTSGLMQYARLIVKQVGLFANTTVCDVNASSASVTLNCPLTSPNGEYTYILLAHFYDEDILTGDSFMVGTPTTFGSAGLFATFMLSIGMALIGLWSPPVAVILAFVGLIAGYTLQLIWVSYASLIAIGVVAVLLAIKMR